MTLRGAERLRSELKQLKSEARPNVIKAIAEARAHGDISENAEYHAAKEQQSFLEGRIGEIENKLANAQVVDVTKLNAGGKVVFGATVKIADADGKQSRWQIGGEDEADSKLEELAERDRLLKPGITVVDLGAAPGAWSQFIQKRYGGRIRIIALDVLPMDPIAGVTIITGDFREEAVLRQLEAAVGETK